VNPVQLSKQLLFDELTKEFTLLLLLIELSLLLRLLSKKTMSNSCTGTDCSNKLAEYKNGIDKLLKRLRDSEHQKSEYEILNLTLKQKLNRPSKIESKHFQRIFNLIQILIDDYFGNKTESRKFVWGLLKDYKPGTITRELQKLRTTISYLIN